MAERERQDRGTEVHETLVEDDVFRVAEPYAPANPVARARAGDAPAARRGERAGAGRGAEPRPEAPPGRVVGGREAAAMVAGVASPEVAQAAAALVGAMGDVRDVVSDDEARLMAGRRVHVPAPGVPPLALEVRRREALAYQAPVGAEVELYQPSVGTEVGAPLPQRRNLPALVGRAVYARDQDNRGVPAPVEPRWFQVYDTPGFFAEAIRVMGRSVFSSFPCFRKQQERRRAEGQDPLGAIHLVANLGGQGPNSMPEIDTVARWVRANGVAVDGFAMTFAHMPDYRPRVVVNCDEERTYLLVMEKREWGCPTDASYVYSWDGGLAYYRDRDDLLEELKGVVTGAARIAAPQARIAPPARGRAGPPAGRAPVPGRPALAVARAAAPARAVAPAMALAGPRLVEEPVRDRGRLAALPTSPPRQLVTAFTEGLVAMGFRRSGSAEGPAFRKALEDGRSLVVMGEVGKPLASSATFRLRSLDEDGAVVSEDLVTTLSEVEDAGRSMGVPVP